MKNGRLLKYALAAVGGAFIIVLTAASVPPDGFRMGRGMEILVNMFREISLMYVDETDPDRLLADAAAGMTSRLDPYTEYISEKNMEDFTALTTGKYGGVGSAVGHKEGYAVFAEVYKDSPAAKAGIDTGDKILAIDGRDAYGMTTAQVSSLLRGDPGTHVKVKVEKFYSGREEEVRVTREIITRSGISYYGMIRNTVGYIAHADFTEDCSNDMRNAVMALKNAGATSLILDYRDNGGGILQEAVCILSLFVPKGTEVVSMKGRSAENNAVFITRNEPIDTAIPITVLINEGSASAAEIVAGALQDLDRAVLVGRRSFGKGLVQSPRPLGYNAYLKITTAKYYLPSGRCIQAVDYARRNEDGGISYIPDSLITEYHTRAGRKVYDGGGVMPDVTAAAEYASRFAYVLYGKGYISDFADMYMKRNSAKRIVPGEFFLFDGDYDDFVAFMADKDVEWESETKRALRLLKEKARQERYFDAVKDDIDLLESKLQDDKANNLELHREELTELLENEIVMRRNYSEGIIEHNLPKDPEVNAAADILADMELYTEIITSRDTVRK